MAVVVWELYGNSYRNYNLEFNGDYDMYFRWYVMVFGL